MGLIAAALNAAGGTLAGAFAGALSATTVPSRQNAVASEAIVSPDGRTSPGHVRPRLLLAGFDRRPPLLPGMRRRGGGPLDGRADADAGGDVHHAHPP